MEPMPHHAPRASDACRCAASCDGTLCNHGRSFPGTGHPVTLICVDSGEDGFGLFDRVSISEAEDYAAGEQSWPIIVKAQPGLSHADIVRHLLYLASVLDRQDAQ
jgi:hypothetical protein